MVSVEFIELALLNMDCTDKTLIRMAGFLKKNGLKIKKKKGNRITTENRNFFVEIEIEENDFAVKKIVPKARCAP